EDLVSEQSSLEMVFQGVVVELSWEPAKPNPVNYMGTGRHAGGYLSVSSDKDARRAEEERVKDLVVIEMVLKIPKQDVIDLTVQLVPKSQNASTLFEWDYQKNVAVKP
ncbi:MAG: hypothetical protein HRU39_03695, partial [Salinicola sp.]|uniref:hypothetical protein n=1 Tax=Salinicola sp. TaxID=1978524 RepID=UPI001D1A844E